MQPERELLFFGFSERDDLTAIVKANQILSYKTFFDDAAHLAAGLKNFDLAEKDYVPVLIEDNLKFVKTTIALWNLSAVPVPLNTKLLDAEIRSIIDDFDFKFIITDRSFADNKIVSEFTVINFDEIKTDSETINLSLPEISDDAVVIFTSGSTGRPKGVVHTFSSLINSIENSNEILNQSIGDRWLASLPFFHIGGFQIVCRSLYYGCSIILPESLQTYDLAQAINNHKPTHISLVSTQLERLINIKTKPDKSIKISLIGGGFIDDELIISSDALGWKSFRVYGSSETASLVTAISADEIKSKPESAGKPLKKVNIQIGNDDEILVNSPSLFKNYLNDEVDTSSKFTDDFFHTGDLGFIDNDGYLFIEARRNDLIVTGGENVNPLEVEKVLMEFDFIREVCVFPKTDKTWGQIVAAAVVPQNSSCNEKRIKELLKERIAGYKIPKVFFFTDKLPRTILGKLEREKIRMMF